MSAKYSKETGGVYPINVYEDFPADALPIPESLLKDFRAGLVGGFDVRDGVVVGVAENEAPISVDAALSSLRAEVQEVLDAKAREFGFEGLADVVTYADEPSVPAFQEAGRSLRAWRSRVWLAFADISAEVKAGERALPSLAEVKAALPDL
ncbi:hypothetical protein LMG26842_02578 [Achromobacter dolens]|uniref:hypothetical protein n=1 Tax=Achromobacter dolens TaxID=1287738 RepID=UPI0014695655|nr:hypothetical protein [Achromobacter dolens]CAB3845713.1 hypothetical protein LMG26842_02578 [Achromobacter dolens]